MLMLAAPIGAAYLQGAVTHGGLLKLLLQPAVGCAEPLHVIRLPMEVSLHGASPTVM